MEDNRIGRRYAQALFTTALKYDVVKSVEDDLSGIDNLLAKDESFRHFLLAPYTSREEKVKVLDRIFSDRITALTMQVLRVMLEKRRENEITSVFHEYVRLRRENEGSVHAVVTSAEALPADQRQALEAKLSSLLGKRIEAEYTVEPALVGGVRVTYDNFVLDGSVRGAMSKLRERLKYDLLKRLS